MGGIPLTRIRTCRTEPKAESAPVSAVVRDLAQGRRRPRPPSDKDTKKQVAEIQKPLPAVQMPKPLPPPPPPSQNMDSVQQATEDARRRNARGRGMQQTLLAGETGGYRPMAQTENGKRTLLG